MLATRPALCLPLLVFLLATGCRPAPATQREEASQSDAPAHGFLVEQEPENARGVLEVKKDGQDGEVVVVVGRVGGPNPFAKGTAAFNIVDLTLEPSGAEGDADPWKFAGIDRTKLAQATLSVRFVNADNESVSQEARELFDLHPGQIVTVQGQLNRDASGVPSVAGRTLYKHPHRPVD
jgi:hypothetical protein